MLELKAFVQESVHALDDAALRVLCDTLRVDARGCDDRRDVERVLTGLLCLDKDTTLGTFLTWLRTRETQSQVHGASGLVARKTAFLNTFVPVISPRRAVAATTSNNNPSHHEANAVKDHHLSDEIASRLEELQLMEHDFKDAERQVHSGTPSFEKLKAFLVKLTKLRAKEQDVRGFFIKQSALLTQQHAEMKDETLHTRAQLDFFVDGFTNLRHRHDELVETSTRMKAENEVAQDVFLSIAAQESHFGTVLHRTMLHMLDEKRVLTQSLDDARAEIQRLNEKQAELEKLVSRLKRERGDALKDASSYKLQLRKCKQKMDSLATDGPDCAYFRQQAIQLRGSLTTLLTLFRDAIARDTKSAKQSLSKDVVRAVQSALLASPEIPGRGTSERPRKPMRITGAVPIDDHGRDPVGAARVVEKTRVTALDVDEVVRGVVLLGGQEGEAATCAVALSQKLRYAPVDLKSLLERIRDETAHENERRAQTAAAAAAVTLTVGDENGNVATAAAPVIVPPVATLPLPPPTVENYLLPLKAAIAKRQVERNAKGAVLYNYELTAREANLLIGAGVPIDSVIDMKLPPPPPPSMSPPVTPLSPINKTSAASKAPTSPSRGATGQATARPTSKAASSSSSSPVRPTSRQPTSDTKKPAATSSSTSRPPTTTTTTGPSPAKPSTAKNVDRRAVFASMPHAFTQLAPVTFADDRVEQVVQELTRQKHTRATPFVAWDNATSQVNEALLMYAEDVHMMIWIEQDNRKPKKPGQETTKPATPASSSAKTSSSTSPTRTGTSSTGSKTPAKVPAKGKATSPTKSPSNPGSPTKVAAKAKPPSPSKAIAKTASPSKPPAVSPKKPTTVTATSPAKRKA